MKKECNLGALSNRRAAADQSAQLLQVTESRGFNGCGLEPVRANHPMDWICRVSPFSQPDRLGRPL